MRSQPRKDRQVIVETRSRTATIDITSSQKHVFKAHQAWMSYRLFALVVGSPYRLARYENAKTR